MFRIALRMTVLFLFGILPCTLTPTTQVEAQQLSRVIIGYPARSIGSIQLFIAQERGFFREEGIQADLTQVRADVAKVGMLTGELFAHNSVGTSVRHFKQEHL